MTEHTHPGHRPQRGAAWQLAIAQTWGATIQQGGSGHHAAVPIFFEVI